MAQAVKDFRDRNFQAVRHQPHTVGQRNALACPDIYTNMVMVAASGEEQRPSVQALSYTQAKKFIVKSLRGGQLLDVKMDVPELELRRRICRHRLGGEGREEVAEIKWCCHHRNLPILPTPV